MKWKEWQAVSCAVCCAVSTYESTRIIVQYVLLLSHVVNE